MSKSVTKTVCITMGDPAGIGPEVIQKAFASRKLNRKKVNYVIIGDRRKIKNISVPIVDVPYKNPAEGSLKFLDQGIQFIKQHIADSLVTAPLSKEAVSGYVSNFRGHTEYLAEAFKIAHVDMMFIGPKVRLAILTRHVPLQKVSSLVTKKSVLVSLELIAQTLRVQFKIRSPRIAVLGLNPHAGEGGLLGVEEIKHIIPAIKTAQQLGIDAQGPYPADTYFAHDKGHDAVLAMYHDQGLAPIKGMYFDTLVNFTAGLPFVRTSPVHGTAYDLVGKNKADPSSMIAAINLAADLT